MFVLRVGKVEVTQDEVVRAAKEANAFDFIMKLPKESNNRTIALIANNFICSP